MAEMDIGKHCAFSSCNQLDFLPFTCDLCGEIFCKEHKFPDCHECSHRNRQESTPFTGVKSYPCHVKDCENKELTNITCKFCRKTVCLSHRHQVDHQCEKLEAPSERMVKTKEHIQQIIDSKMQSKPAKSGVKGRKSKVTAAKVALMKIKMKAVGDKGTPDNERVHLQVVLPPGGKDKEKPMFFSKKWTVGRVIDQMANLAGIQNYNNVSTAKKLRLFDDDHQEMFSCELTLETLLETPEPLLINGGTVILDLIS